MWTTVSHEGVKRILELQIRRQSFAHAYLFVGPTGIGKRTLAYEFASKILDVTSSQRSPDFITFDASTGVEELRGLLSQLGVKPFTGRYKVAVIDNFEAATTQAANALLKTLEEPSPSTIMILISGSRNLLPTIISRCQEFVFNPLSDSALQDCVNIWQLDRSVVTEEMIISSHGSAARLRQLIDSPEEARAVLDSVNRLNKVMQSSTAERLLLVNELAELDTDRLVTLLTAWIHDLRIQLTARPALSHQIVKASEAIISIQRSINKKMTLQHLLISSTA